MRPDETEPYEQDGMIEYAAVHYTVSGSILTSSKKETRLEDTETLRLIFEPGGKDADAYYPNEQEEPYFYITVQGVKLSSASEFLCASELILQKRTSSFD